MPGVIAMRAAEAARGIADGAFYQGFNARVAAVLAAFRA